MTEEPRTSGFDRVSVGVLERAAERMWGFRPNLMREIVARRGGLGALTWFVTNMPRYERTLAKDGAVRTHLWCSAISIDNGCAYCTYGHSLALQLAFLRARDRLFALDEAQLVALIQLDRVERRRAVAAAVVASGIDEELGSLRRLTDLYDGAAATSRLDRRLSHLVRMFAVLNLCGREGCVAPDEAHDPLNKDVELVGRYRTLRANGSESAVPPG